jgi:hypothetical protein
MKPIVEAVTLAWLTAVLVFGFLFGLAVLAALLAYHSGNLVGLVGLVGIAIVALAGLCDLVLDTTIVLWKGSGRGGR